MFTCERIFQCIATNFKTKEMTKKILIVGVEKTPLIAQQMREIHGNDIVLVTQEEAKEQNLSFEHIENVQFKIEPYDSRYIDALTPKSGKEKRRERRKQKRKL